MSCARGQGCVALSWGVGLIAHGSLPCSIRLVRKTVLEGTALMLWMSAK